MRVTVIVGLSAWGFILGIIFLNLLNKIQMGWQNWFFFAFLCFVGVAAASMDRR